MVEHCSLYAVIAFIPGFPWAHCSKKNFCRTSCTVATPSFVNCATQHFKQGLLRCAAKVVQKTAKKPERPQINVSLQRRKHLPREIFSERSMMADNAQNKLCLSVAPKKVFKAKLPAKVRPCLVL